MAAGSVSSVPPRDGRPDDAAPLVAASSTTARRSLHTNATAASIDAVEASSYYGATRKGYAPYNPRKKNQDAYIVREDRATQTLTIAVLDGHGEAGDAVSTYIATRLCDALFARPEWRRGDVDGIAAAMLATIRELEHRLIAVDAPRRGLDVDFSGTTLVLCALRAGVLVTAHVGDSRAVLGRASYVAGRAQTRRRRGHDDDDDLPFAATTTTTMPTSTSSSSSSTSGTTPQKTAPYARLRTTTTTRRALPTASVSYRALPLTVDHKPDIDAERCRVVEAGGRVFAVTYDDGVVGPPRVWLGHADVPGLAMSRSLGDVVAHTAGVSSEPDVSVRVLDPSGDAFLVVATDGLWEFMSDDDVVDVVSRVVGGRRPLSGASASNSDDDDDDDGESSSASEADDDASAAASSSSSSPKSPGWARAVPPWSRAQTEDRTRSCVHALLDESSRRWMANEVVIDDATVVVAFLRPTAGGARTDATVRDDAGSSYGGTTTTDAVVVSASSSSSSSSEETSSSSSSSSSTAS